MTNALIHTLPYGDDLARVWEGKQGSDAKTLQTRIEGTVLVDLANEEATEELAEQVAAKHGNAGDLMTGVPTIEMTIGGVKRVLTWQEAYNLGEMLIRQVNVALYG